MTQNSHRRDQFANYLPVDVQTGRFPNILAGRIDPVQQLAIACSMLAAVYFSIAVLGNKRAGLKHRISQLQL